MAFDLFYAREGRWFPHMRYGPDRQRTAEQEAQGLAERDSIDAVVLVAVTGALPEPLVELGRPEILNTFDYASACRGNTGHFLARLFGLAIGTLFCSMTLALIAYVFSRSDQGQALVGHLPSLPLFAFMLGLPLSFALLLTSSFALPVRMRIKG